LLKKYIETDEAFKVYLDPPEKKIYLTKFLLEAFKENIFQLAHTPPHAGTQENDTPAGD